MLEEKTLEDSNKNAFGRKYKFEPLIKRIFHKQP